MSTPLQNLSREVQLITARIAKAEAELDDPRVHRGFDATVALRSAVSWARVAAIVVPVLAGLYIAAQEANAGHEPGVGALVLCVLVGPAIAACAAMVGIEVFERQALRAIYRTVIPAFPEQ